MKKRRSLTCMAQKFAYKTSVDHKHFAVVRHSFVHNNNNLNYSYTSYNHILMRKMQYAIASTRFIRECIKIGWKNSPCTFRQWKKTRTKNVGFYIKTNILSKKKNGLKKLMEIGRRRQCHRTEKTCAHFLLSSLILHALRKNVVGTNR